MTGDVDLNVTFLDVVGLGIVGEAVRQQAEDADARARGADLDIGRIKTVYDSLRPREQFAVLDTVIEVDAHDFAADTDTDAVIICCRCRSIESRKGGRVAHAGSACCPRYIRHLGLVAVPLFIFPVTELSVAFEKRRYFFKLNLHCVCLLSILCFCAYSS